jgi:hypothetical protein
VAACPPRARPNGGTHVRIAHDHAQHLKGAKLRPREEDRREEKRAAKGIIGAGAP